MKKNNNRIAVILGSKNDLGIIKDGIDLLEESGLAYELKVLSAHRNPEQLRRFCLDMEKNSFSVVIACAGMAAALPGFIASYVNIPVIGVALKGGILDGMDALFSMVSTPKGLGIACSGIGKSAFLNAVILAAEILSLRDKKYYSVVKKLKGKFK